MASQHNEDRDFRLGGWLVQPSLGRVSGPSGETQLEPRAIDVLVFLAGRAGRVVSRRQIVDAVWRQEFVSDASVSGIIAKLRKAFDDDARNPRVIETIPKRGYRLLPLPVDVLAVAARPGGAFRVGEWLVEPSLNRMSRDDASILLDRSTMDVLLCLAERAGEPVPRRQLIDRVWQTEAVSELKVSRHIAELQEALGDSDRDSRYIESLPGSNYRLMAAVALAKPDATVAPFPARPAEAERKPYPGLAAFTEADAGLFFGREAETGAMWRRITGHRLLAVIGPSGVGKSSFMRAGVIAAAPPGWVHLVCVPGEAPFMAMARALLPQLAGEIDEVEQLFDFDDPEVTVAVMARWRERHGDALLVVDQFEELFTLNPPETRGRFVDLILRLVTEARVHLVLVLRDDFLGECHAHPQLAPIFRELTMLGPPAAGDLRRALVEPARQRDFHFEDEALADEMVATVAEERGALPLLAFAARRMWELRDEEQRVLTREAYERIGGVGGALAQHAEATIDTIGHDRLPVVRELFRNLVTAQTTRAARSVDDLLSVFDEGEREAAEEVLQTLIDARLLTTFEEEGEGDEGTRRVEVVHESLLREWPRLVRWQTQDADSARLRDQLRQAAQLWHARGRPNELLWTGTPYREFSVWRESYPGGLTTVEEEFAAAMAGYAGRRRRRHRLAVAAVLLAAVAVAAATTTLWRRSELHGRRLEAQRLSERARQAMSRSPPVALAYAVASLELVDGLAERRLALKALWSSPMPLVIGADQLPAMGCGVDISPDGRWLAVGHFEGYLSLWPRSGGAPTVWRPHDEATGRGYFSPDSRTLAWFHVGDPNATVFTVPEARRLGTLPFTDNPRDDYTVRQANINRGLRRDVRDPSVPGGWKYDRRPERVLEPLTGGRVPAASLSPDGSHMVVAVGEELRLFSLADPDAPATLVARCPSAVEHVVFGPEGDRLATAHADGALRLWSLSAGVAELLRDWPGTDDKAYEDLRFDPTGTLLAAAIDGGTAVIRAVHEPPGADPLLLLPNEGRLIEVAFDPDGRWLATASLRRVCMWPLDRDRHPYVLRGHAGTVEGVAFDPDGAWLVSYGGDGTLRQWPLAPAAGASTRLLYDWGRPHERMIGWMALSPDGRFVVTTGGDNSARLVPLDGSPPRVLGGFDHRVYAVAVGGEGRWVAIPGSRSDQRVVRVWDLETDAVTDVDLEAPDGSIFSWLVDVEIAADGRVLVAEWGRLLELDPETGLSRLVAEDVGSFVLARDQTLLLSRAHIDGITGVVTVHDLVEGTATELPGHGDGVFSFALDASGTIVVTGSDDGIVRVGPVDGGTPHWLVGHDGRVSTVAVSPDGRWIASGGRDGTIRLWPMPDLTRPPLHDLPRAELLARLRSLTNLRAVRDPEDPDRVLVRADPFPGWHTVPEW